MKYTYKAILKNVVDGDTVDVTIDLGFSIYHTIRIRLAGIDTAELNSPDAGERELAKKAKEYLTQFVGNQIIVDSVGKDKYGRYLAYLTIGLLDVNNKLISEGLAKPYGQSA